MDASEWRETSRMKIVVGLEISVPSSPRVATLLAMTIAAAAYVPFPSTASSAARFWRELIVHG
jgi:hypothetical protein